MIQRCRSQYNPLPFVSGHCTINYNSKNENGPSMVSLFTLVEWYVSFHNILQDQRCVSKIESIVSTRIVVLRVCAALAAREIHLHTCIVGDKQQRFFVDSKASVKKTVAAAVVADSIAKNNPIFLKAENLYSEDSGAMLDILGKRYLERKLSYYSLYKTADFSFIEEITAVSHPLWTRTSLECASNDLRAHWRRLLCRYQPQSADYVEDLFSLFNLSVPKMSENLSKEEKKIVSTVFLMLRCKYFSDAAKHQDHSYHPLAQQAC